ncbi:MAG: amidohydrolase family protein, partial [Bacteroidetes bacterium]|nr:amidohydrolase family protein [Bacteroidota bacterium]
MSYQYQVILKNSFVVDPTNNRSGVFDIGIQGGKIVDIASNLKSSQAEESFDLRGYHTIPGIIDLHVHASSWLGGKFGHKMMAKAGVTTALDMSGPIDSVLDIAVSHGVGLNLACIQYVRPGHTVDSNDPNRSELEKMIKFSLERGAYGIKLLGGHYPLSPEATSNAVELAHQQNAYCAFHAGTLSNKSDLEGLYEAVELIGKYPVHLAHINSYCRGKIKPAMVEAEEAIELLKKNPHICSESYLSPVNGTSGKCSGGLPESQVTVMCLGTGGFEATQKGLEDAIMKGWAQVNL